MPRLRLAVALLVPAPVADEVDVLRRACSDPMLGRVAPHLTLVPPVNVREERVEEALAVLRSAASATRPFTVALGPPATFLPVNPVLYLAVDDPDGAVVALRDRVFRPPLERALRLPFVPHVTLTELGDRRVSASVEALAGYRAQVAFERVHLMLEADRRWAPWADASFGAPAVVGRGGLELELAVTEGLAPDVAAWRDAEWAAYQREAYGAREPERPLVVTGRRAGEVVGAADGSVRGDEAYLASLIVAPAVRNEGVGSHLLAAFSAESARRGATSVVLRTLAGGGAERLYRARGFTTVADLPAWRHGRDFVQLRRSL